MEGNLSGSQTVFRIKNYKSIFTEMTLDLKCPRLYIFWTVLNLNLKSELIESIKNIGLSETINIYLKRLKGCGFEIDPTVQ